MAASLLCLTGISEVSARGPPAPGTVSAMRGRGVGLAVAWLVFLVAVQVVAFVALWRFAVRTEHGQLLDSIALEGNSIGRDRVDGLVDRVLNAMSVVSLVAATAIVGFIALVRRGLWLAFVGTLLVVGANLTTQVLKHLITRPDLGIDPERASAGNSLPSGHTAVAASVAVALVLVLPSKVRAWWAVLGAGYTALAGVATMSAGWHRPSDAVASLLVVGAWAGVAGLLLIAGQRGDVPVPPGGAHRLTAVALAVAGIAFLGAAWVAVNWTDAVLQTPVDNLNRGRLFIAYAGSAAGISGVTCLLFAAVLATVHQVVPRRAAGIAGSVVGIP